MRLNVNWVGALLCEGATVECAGPHRHEPGHLGSWQLCLCSLAHSNDSNTLTASTLFIPLFTQKTLMFLLPVLGWGEGHISSGWVNFRG